MAQQWLGRAVTRVTTGAQNVGGQLNRLSQQLQETATVACGLCGQRYLHANIFRCQECSKTFCRNCKLDEGLLPFIQLTAEGRTQLVACRDCGPRLQERNRQANVEFRMKRANAFLLDRLEPFAYDPEKKLEKALRLGGHAFTGLKQVGSFIPLWKAATAVKAGYYLVRYGPLMLAGNEIVEAFQLLSSLATKVETPSARRLVSPDFFGGLYYMMGEVTGERGRTPELEAMEHLDTSSGKVPEPERELLVQLQKPLQMLYISKEPTPTDAQRLLRQAWPGAQLVLSEYSDTTAIPTYFVVCHGAERMVYLLLPGTRNPADLATDFNAHEEPVGKGWAHRGMTLAARWLLGEVAPVLIRLYTEGYKVTIVGHSLGAGVGAIFSVLLRPQISSIRCYGFGTPACVDETLLPELLDCMVSVVNRDDMVPRLSVQSVQRLLQSTLCVGQVEKTQKWMAEDWKAVKDVERVMELRRRGGIPGAAASMPESNMMGEVADGSQDADVDEQSKIAMLVDAGVSIEAAKRALRQESGDLSRALLAATEEEHDVAPMEVDSRPVEEQGSTSSSASVCEAPRGPASAQDVDASYAAAAADSDITTSRNRKPRLHQAAADVFSGVTTGVVGVAAGAQSWIAGMQGPRPDSAATSIRLGPEVGDSDAPASTNDQAMASHVQFVIPGQIIHLYRQNGIGRAARAAYSHETFTRFTLSQSMLKDHALPAYDEALRQAVLKEPKVPKWESSSERNVCACCEADFSWAYILQSEPQKMLARHHCLSCGRVVCDGCSQRRIAHPELGFLTPVRTCDGCFFRAARSEAAA